MERQLFYLVYLFLLIMHASMAQNPFACDPVTDCLNSIPDAMVPDPNNCEKYYVCVERPNGEIVPSFHSYQCPKGQYYDQTVKNCKDELVYGSCVNQCNPGCAFECPPFYNGLDYVGYKYNCSRYFRCSEVAITPLSCPADAPYFNGVSCVDDSVQCCDYCTAYCPVPFREIQDPCDCISYYGCDDNAQITYKRTCPVGTYFDESASQCMSGMCTSICPQCG